MKFKFVVEYKIPVFSANILSKAEDRVIEEDARTVFSDKFKEHGLELISLEIIRDKKA